MKALLDTHILVRWVSHPDDLSPAQRHAVGLASAHVHAAALLTNDRRIRDAAFVTTI